MLLSAGINLPKEILVHGFVNDKDGAKMSKSVGNVINPQEMVNTYCSDTFRLYITGEVGVGQDLNFSDDRIKAIHNDMLANNYGNLVNRVISLWIAYRDSGETIPNMPEAPEMTLAIIQTYKEALEKWNNPQMMISHINTLLNMVNVMLNTTEPWKKSGIEKGTILLEGLVYVYYCTLLFSPFIPEATGKVMKAMGIDPKTTLDTPMNIDLNKIVKPEILFEKK
jgi:methionyl-tRNA synthetase